LICFSWMKYPAGITAIPIEPFQPIYSMPKLI
jgi:hypothetical protein